MNKQTIVLRGEASTKVGYGHFYRLIALSSLLGTNFEYVFLSFYIPENLQLILEAKKIDLQLIADEHKELLFLKNLCHVKSIKCIIVDGYDFDQHYYNKLVQIHELKIIRIDDFGKYYGVENVIFNHAPLIGLNNYPHLPSEVKLGLGADFLMLRKAFLDAARKESFRGIPKLIRNIFLCVGGTDPLGYTEKIVLALIQIPEIEEILVISKNAELVENSPKIKVKNGLGEVELINLIHRSDLAICPPSTISLEICCVRVPIGLIQVSDNQDFIKHGLIKSGCAVEIKINQLEFDLRKLAGLTQNQRQNMIENQKSIFDGYSKNRILKLLKKI